MIRDIVFYFLIKKHKVLYMFFMYVYGLNLHLFQQILSGV